MRINGHNASLYYVYISTYHNRITIFILQIYDGIKSHSFKALIAVLIPQLYNLYLFLKILNRIQYHIVETLVQ